MQTTLDQEERVEMSLKVQRIGMGVDPDHGVEGLFPTFGVMNGISPEIWWPYLHRVDDSIQLAHASHRHDEIWLDSTHPHYPVLPRRSSLTTLRPAPPGAVLGCARIGASGVNSLTLCESESERDTGGHSG